MPVPEEIYIYIFAKEFGWLPSETRKESAKDIKLLLHIMSSFNRGEKEEKERIEMKNRIKKGGGRRGIDVSDPNVKKWIMKEHGLKD